MTADQSGGEIKSHSSKFADGASKACVICKSHVNYLRISYLQKNFHTLDENGKYIPESVSLKFANIYTLYFRLP